MRKILLLIIMPIFCFSQNNNEIDSLKVIAESTKNDSVKVSVLNKIAFSYIFNDEKRAKEFLRKSEKIALSKKILYGQNEILNIKGIFHDISGNSDSANYYFQKSLVFSKRHNFKVMEARSVNNLGMYNWNKGNWNEALSYFFAALKINDKLPVGKKINESICYNNIGLIYQEMRLFDKAISFHNKAYVIRLKDNLYKDQAISLNNIGICYRNKNDYKNAILIFNKGIDVAKKSNNLIEYSKITENLGSVYLDLENYQKALLLNLEAKKIREKNATSPKEEILLNTYISLCYNKLKNYQLSLKYCDNALKILNENKDLKTYATDLYKVAASTNFALNNIQQGDEYTTLYYNLLNENFSIENSKHVAELETKYLTEKKEKQILKQQAEAKQKNIWLLLISSIAIIVLLLFRNQVLKTKQQKNQAKLEKELLQEQSNYKIQEQRLDISRELHDNVGSQLTFIISILDNLKNAPVKFDENSSKKIESVSNFANKSITELRDTIWVLNSKSLDLEELKNKMLNYIKDASESVENTKFDFNFDVKNNIQLSSKQAINIFRVLQEIVNNALKHANSSQISVIITQNQNNLEMEIQDNGIGFNFDEKKKKSFGLTNIQNRVREINGMLKVHSQQDKGTNYLITITL